MGLSDLAYGTNGDSGPHCALDRLVRAGNTRLITRSLCLRALKDWASLTLVPLKFWDEEIYLAAVGPSSAIENFSKIPKEEQTVEICETAMRRCGHLQHVREDLSTFEICEIAVKHWGGSLQHVPEEFLTENMFLIAVRSTHASRALDHIPDEFRTIDLYTEMVRAHRWHMSSVPDDLQGEVRAQLDAETTSDV
jgi:hypothetical protein